MDNDRTRSLLLVLATRGRWEKLIEIYRNDSTLYKARITKTGDTALHIAVSDGKEDVVKNMVDLMMASVSPEAYKQVLKTHNDGKNTALHLAASMGNATICHILASAESSLVDDRNVDGETPLFLAALHGRKQAFLCLHRIRNPSNYDIPYYPNCRRNNGDTILLCAIRGDYFDMAIQIIHLYRELVNWVNEEGLSPLHLLASKPSAFRSGLRLGFTETIIYKCTYVEELKATDPMYELQTDPIAPRDSDNHEYPENYNTCWHVLRFMIGESVIKFLKGESVRKGDKVGKNGQDLEVANTSTDFGGSRGNKARVNTFFPANYRTCCNLIKFLYRMLLTILGLIYWKGSEKFKKIHRLKEKNTWSVQLVSALLFPSGYSYEDNGSMPQEVDIEVDMMTMFATSIKPRSMKIIEGEQHPEWRVKETPILVAAKNGVMEIVEEIVRLFPVAVYDLNEKQKNIVLLAAEHRQSHVYEFLLNKNIFKESVFRQVDEEGNSSLHLAAKLGDYKPWLTGETLLMQWELQWYKFVEESLPPDFSYLYNKKNQTPDDIFIKTHENLKISSGEVLNKTLDSGLVVATLIAAVSFATAATVPGGVKQETGQPTLEKEPAFVVFAISSLIALCCSITAVVMFLSIQLASNFLRQNLNKELPGKLLVGLTALFISITSMLVSFCAGHFFVVRDKLQHTTLPIYVVTCLPVIIFVSAHFPLYFNLLLATFGRVPQRGYQAP